MGMPPSSVDRRSPVKGRSMRARRWRILLGVVLTTAVFLAAVAGDLLDFIPGPLSLSPSHVGTLPQPAVLGRPAIVAGRLEAGGSVDAASLDRIVDEFTSSPGLGGDYSFVIERPDGTRLAGKDEKRSREPASTLKTLTAAAAIHALDMSSTLNTDVMLSNDGGTSGRRADLHLRGGGDMLLGSGADDPHHVNGRSGLGSLAQRTARLLRDRGISAVSLTCDDTLFGGDGAPKGIERNNPGGIYFMPPSPMAIDQGRDWSGRGVPSDPDGENGYPPRYGHPATRACQVFSSSLIGQGIKVNGGSDPSSAPLPPSGRTPSSARRIARGQSATLGQILALMLRNSDNSLAELFGRLIALKTGGDNSAKGAKDAVLSALKAAGINVEGVTLADCSGLSPGSSIRVETLAAVQRQALAGGEQADLVEGLSVMGLVGTAAGRSVGDGVPGLARVKTGTLDEVTSMCGIVSRKSGGALAFAVIVNKAENGYEASQAINRLVSSLVDL